MPEGKKLPHNPSRTIGRWAVSMGQQLFKIEQTRVLGDELFYGGTGLHGQPVTSACPTLLRLEDNQFLEDHHEAE